MKIKPYHQEWVEPLAKHLQDLHSEWLPLMGLQGWRDESFVDLEATDDGALTHGMVEAADWEYERFMIRYSPNLLTKLQDDPGFVEWVVVHELSHIVSCPIRDLLMDMLDEISEDEDAAEVILERLAVRLDDQWTSRNATALIAARENGRRLAASERSGVAAFFAERKLSLEE